MKKETLGIEKIEKLLSLIPAERRSEYDVKLIEELYLQMQASDVDDVNAYKELKKRVENRDVLVLGPGASIVKYEKEIKERVANTVVISTNFIPSNYKVDALFISNDKRLATLNLNEANMILATSNLHDEVNASLMFNYSSLLGEGDASDNAGAMLIRILKNSGVKKVLLAGFDGFDVDSSVNYAVNTFKKSLDYDTAKRKTKIYLNN